MSTKIYHGCALPRMELDDLFQFFKTFSVKAQALRKRLVIKRAANIAAETLDKRALYTKHLTGTDTALRIAIDTLHRIEKLLGQGNPDFKIYGCTIGWAPTPTRILALPFCDGNEMVDLWYQQPGVEPWGYWDNTDPPEDVSLKEFKARGKEWDVALGHKPPVEAMFMWQATQTYLPLPTVERMVKAMPSYEARVRGFATETLHQERKEKQSLVSNMLDTAAWLKTPEGKQTLAKLSDKIRPILKPEYTKEDLLHQLDATF